MEIARLLLYASSVHAAGYFVPAPFAAPVTAATFTVPLAHAFPFLPIGDDRVAFIDKFLMSRRRNAVNDGNEISRAALRTCTRFPSFPAFVGGPF
jgi:hypothetical protein